MEATKDPGLSWPPVATLKNKILLIRNDFSDDLGKKMPSSDGFDTRGAAKNHLKSPVLVVDDTPFSRVNCGMGV